MAGAAKLLETLAAAIPLAKQAEKAAPGIKVWHASPYDFDKFDLSKIGTGQGAQSYGHGIYFAENPKVSGPGGEYWNEFSRRTKNGPEVLAQYWLKRSDFDRGLAAEKLQQSLKSADPKDPRDALSLMQADDALKLLRSNEQVGPRVYEAQLNARPEQFLDWDKPRKAQSQEVQEALNRIKPSTFSNTSMYPPRYTGREIYRTLEEDLPGVKQYGGTFIDRAAPSAALREAGIPGIRYLDQGSRNLDENIARLQGKVDTAPNPVAESIYRRQLEQLQARSPTYNYVVNNPDIIDILRKLAVPGMVGGGAATAYQPQGGQ